jgi:hypothetical protein
MLADRVLVQGGRLDAMFCATDEFGPTALRILRGL